MQDHKLVKNVFAHDCISADVVMDTSGRLLFRKTFTWPAKNLAAREIATATIIGKHKHLNELFFYRVVDEERFELFYRFVGAHLSQRLKTCASDHRWIKQAFRAIVSGVQHMHERNITHRNLQLENVMINEYDTPEICNFSSCEWINSTQCGSQLTDETALAKQQIGQSDTFALGVLLYEMITERHAFQDLPSNEAGQLEFPPWITGDLKALLAGMLESDPLERLSMEGILGHKWFQSSPPRRQTRA